MGMGSVDLAVLWPKNYGQFDVCYKPTSRLGQFASLGIPVVAYPFASYVDMFVCSPCAFRSMHILTQQQCGLLICLATCHATNHEA